MSIGRFVKSALFEKKNFFLNITGTYQDQLPSRGDWTSTCPSRLYKFPFVKQRCPFIGGKSPFLRTIWSNSFILDKFLNFAYFSFEIFLSVFWLTRHKDLYAIKMRTLIEKCLYCVEKKFVMKYLFTNQNFHKPKFPLFQGFNFLKKDIYVNPLTTNVPII